MMKKKLERRIEKLSEITMVDQWLNTRVTSSKKKVERRELC